MLKKIYIENFKSFAQHTEICFNDFSLFSGLNSSGKSSIYQLLLLLKQSQNSIITDLYGNILPSLELNGDYVSLGTNKEVLSDENKKYFIIEFAFNDNNMVKYKFSLPDDKDSVGYDSEKGKVFFLSELGFYSKVNSYSFNIALRERKWSISASNSMVFFDTDLQYYAKKYLENLLFPSDEEIFYSEDLLDDDEVVAENIDGVSNEFLDTISIRGLRSVDLTGYDAREIMIESVYFKELLQPIYRDLFDLDDFAEFLKQYNLSIDNFSLRSSYSISAYFHSLLMKRVRYIPPFRGNPRRVYTAGEDFPLVNYNNLKSNVVCYDYDFGKGVKKENTLEVAIRYWIVDLLGLAEDVFVNHREEISSELFLVVNSKKIPINNVGFGTGQIVPIIYKILIAPSKSVIIIDEPETHLHASVQSVLADFLLAMAMCDKKIIVETHSEYMIDKLIYYSVKYPNVSSKISLNWITRDGISSTVSEIEFDQLGFITNAPIGFLSEKARLVDELNAIRMEKFVSES